MNHVWGQILIKESPVSRVSLGVREINAEIFRVILKPELPDCQEKIPVDTQCLPLLRKTAPFEGK